MVLACQLVLFIVWLRLKLDLEQQSTQSKLLQWTIQITLISCSFHRRDISKTKQNKKTQPNKKKPRGISVSSGLSSCIKRILSERFKLHFFNAAQIALVD